MEVVTSSDVEDPNDSIEILDGSIHMGDTEDDNIEMEMSF